MLYPELFKTLESARWDMETGVPWSDFEDDKLTEEQAQTVRMNAITEWSALPATEMFLRDNMGDSDFSAFMSVWFYEEQKHALVLMEYLRRFRPALAPTEEELSKVRFPFDPAPPFETLMLHYCGEIRLNQWYRRASAWHTEPVIKRIYELLAADEARHAGAYFRYMRRAIDRFGDLASLSFARIGVLMANTRSSRALHPTNLHVSKEHYPLDTVQSRLPDPGWLEHWLDSQINFDKSWEEKVSRTILRKLSNLFGTDFQSIRDLRAFRKLLEGNAALPESESEQQASPA
ncbi:MAG: ferritin-like domain-containing protein [Gammaproteobacteria bacterium]|nr:ferritin-like domain-containing protein [Gammaproteobacteria bacterium]